MANEHDEHAMTCQPHAHRAAIIACVQSCASHSLCFALLYHCRFGGVNHVLWQRRELRSRSPFRRSLIQNETSRHWHRPCGDDATTEYQRCRRALKKGGRHIEPSHHLSRSFNVLPAKPFKRLPAFKPPASLAAFFWPLTFSSSAM